MLKTTAAIVAATLGGYVPIVVRINPDHFSDIDVAGAGAQYLGLQIVHATDPTLLKVQAGFTRDFQSPPAATHFTSGFTIKCLAEAMK